jgi:hypothetical protein
MSTWYLGRRRASLLIGLSALGYLGSASLIGFDHHAGRKYDLETREGYDIGTITSAVLTIVAGRNLFKGSVFFLLAGMGGVSLIANASKSMEYRRGERGSFKH